MFYFLLGPTRCGKTTAARLLEERLETPTYEAGAWAIEGSGLSKETMRPLVTEYALKALRRDPYVSLKKIQQFKSTNKSGIIVGIRNPVDFFGSYDPKVDKVFVLGNTFNNATNNHHQFDSGLEAILMGLQWLDKQRIVPCGSVVQLHHSSQVKEIPLP